MRFLLTVIVLAAVGYFGYNYYLDNKAELDEKLASLTEKVNPDAESGDSSGGPTATTPPAPTFQSKIEIPDGPEGQKKVAPPGVFYMLDRVSFETPSGVRAINPGEQVKLLQRMKDGRMKVTADGSDFEVKDKQVTNDLEVAQQAEKGDFVKRGGKL